MIRSGLIPVRKPEVLRRLSKVGQEVVILRYNGTVTSPPVPLESFKEHLKSDGINEYAEPELQFMAVVKGMQYVDFEPVE